MQILAMASNLLAMASLAIMLYHTDIYTDTLQVASVFSQCLGAMAELSQGASLGANVS